MRSILLVLCCCASSAASAEDKPVLVLNAGGQTTRAVTVLFTLDGRQAISVSYDKTIRFWDVDTGEPVRILLAKSGG